MSLGMSRVEIDHLGVRMESFKDGFTRYPRWERGDSGEDGFRHDNRDDFCDGLRKFDRKCRRRKRMR